MASFLNVLLTKVLSVNNTTLTTTPINDVPAPNELAATSASYNPAFQVGTSSTPIVIPAPATEAQIVYMKNLDTVNEIIFAFTPSGGSATVIYLLPGAVFLYFNPFSGAGGIGSMSATAYSATCNAELFLAY